MNSQAHKQENGEPDVLRDDPDTPEEANPYWGRPTLLDWYMNLGFRGKLRWLGGVFVVANGIAYLCGFFWPRMLFTGIGILVISFLMPSSVDD